MNKEVNKQSKPSISGCNWNIFQSCQTYTPTELQVYPNAAQGIVQVTAGTDQVRRSTSASANTPTQPANTATSATTTPATPTTAATTPSASGSATTQAASGSDPIQYQGSVLISTGYADLDSVPVDNGDNLQGACLGPVNNQV